MGGVSLSWGDPPAAEDCRGVAQSFDSLRSLRMVSEAEGRVEPSFDSLRSLGIPSVVEGRQDPPRRTTWLAVQWEFGGISGY